MRARAKAAVIRTTVTTVARPPGLYNIKAAIAKLMTPTNYTRRNGCLSENISKTLATSPFFLQFFQFPLNNIESKDRNVTAT